MSKIAVAMSGGVDSACAALLLQQQGHVVEGMTFQLGVEDGSAHDAAQVCTALGIGHRVLCYDDLFEREVITPFVDAYLAGETPNPCVMCNQAVKFGRFFNDALSLGFDGIATGHYAGVECRAGHFALCKAFDRAKDQSYVLYQLGQRELSRLWLPIGQSGLSKSALREMARRNGLPVADRPDSQDICFIPDGNYAAFIERRTGPGRSGRFLDETGRFLGEHQGFWRYTPGQRRGLGISMGQRAFVCAVDSESGDVTLTCDERRLFGTVVFARNATFCDGVVREAPFKAAARIRYSHCESPALVVPLGGGRLHVTFAQPQRAATAGQSIVFYCGDEVLGGAVIQSADEKGGV